MSTGRLVRSAGVVSFYTGLSRVLGLVREMCMAYYFGTTLAKSAFDVAFRVPNLLRNLLGEGALSAAFVPVFTEVLTREGREAAARMASRMALLLGMVLILLVGIGWGGAALLAGYAAPGSRLAIVLPMLNIMMPYAFFICLVALAMGVLNSLDHFALPAATPLILNVVSILAMVTICARMPVDSALRIQVVAWAVPVAGLIQLAVQVPALRAHGLVLRPAGCWSPEIRRVIRQMGPAAFGMGVHQVNILIDGVLAMWAGSWAPAALTYAERLVFLPLGLFATAMGTVLLPAFSRHIAAGEPGRVLAALRETLPLLMLVMIPASVGLCVLAGPIVELLFSWRGGAFNAMSALLTTRALQFYAPGLVVFSVYKLLAPVFYAQQDLRTPVRVGVWAVLINLALNIASVLWLPEYYRHAGMAGSSVLASGVNGVVLGIILTRRNGNPGWGHMAARCLRMLLCAALMGVVAWFVVQGGSHLLGPGKLARALATAAAIAAALLCYAAAIRLTCAEEWRTLLRRRRQRRV